MPALCGLADAIGSCEGWLAFAAALACGAAARFADRARGASPALRDGAVRWYLTKSNIDGHEVLTSRDDGKEVRDGR